jgi:hypothetical protein
MLKSAMRFLEAVLVLAAIPATVCGLLLAAFAMSADGYAFPGQLYSLLGNPSAGSRITPSKDLLLAPDTPAARMRDTAFEWFNIRAEARAWMRALPITFDPEATVAGAYDPVHDTVRIGQPFLHVFLHEYGHANLDHQSAWTKLQFSAALVRLTLDRDPSCAEARNIFEGNLGKAIEAGGYGQSYNPVQEFYAEMAQLSGGDIRRIPPCLQPFFADYLSSGTNDWWLLQKGEPVESFDQSRTEGFVMKLR